MSPLSLLDQMLAVVNRPVHPDKHAPVARLLAGRYSGFSVDYTIRCLESGMAPASLHWLLPEDAEAIEAMLSDDGDCIPECACHRDETAYRRQCLRPAGGLKAVDDSDLDTEHAF